MSYVRRRRVGTLCIIGALMVPLAIVSTAWACGRLATLRLSSASAKPGQELTGFGGNYNSLATSSDVTVRLGGRSGSVLWQGRAGQNGAISPAFTVPRLKAGYYPIVATQSLANGTPAAGTPGRAVLRIGHPKARRTAASGAALWAPGGPPANDRGPSGGAPAVAGRSISVPAPVVAGGAVLFVVLMGTGVMVLRGTRRTRPA
jgi:hypothetical protein